MFSQRNNPYCELLKFCSAKIKKILIRKHDTKKKNINFAKYLFK